MGEQTAIGATLDDVVRVVAYLPDRADLPALAAVLKQRLGAARPANTTVCCPLAVDDAMETIEGLPATKNVLRNDTDPDGPGELTVTGVDDSATAG